MEDQKKIEQVSFDNEVYNISDLTPRAIEGFNTLIKAQQKLNDIVVEVKILQSGQAGISAELKTIIEEDKIKPQVQVEQEQVEEAK